MTSTYRSRLLATTLFVSASVLATPVLAQEVQEPVVGDPAQAVDESAAPSEAPGEEIVVTGSRIARPNLVSNSPIAVVTGEEVVANADITLETFLNTLPQANPAGTTTSNNPGNGGASNINLRGLGSNRNLVLIDGRRPMVGSTAQDVDLNTIPQGLIERIEVITGGAGATYGADAIAGAVNIIMKDDFEGVELRGTYANTIPEVDAREYQISGTFGGNFDDGRGNLAVSVEYSDRQSLEKSQRAFAQQATSTTRTPPVGRLVESGTNPFDQGAIDTVFGSYAGVDPDQIPGVGQSNIHFNQDGTLFGSGIFNNPSDLVNYRYDPLGQDPAAANQNYVPDFYSYNFDLVNFLVLPLKRKSAFLKGNYEINEHFDVFVQGGYTEYQTSNALAPTPIGTRIYGTGTAPGQQFGQSDLIEGGQFVTANVIPVTNPFIPADLAALLASRAAGNDDPRLVGSGADEPFQVAIRTLSVGLRETKFDTQVLQGLAGVRGDINDNWRYEVMGSWGRTIIDAAATGNVNVDKLQDLLEADDGGDSICAGGYNPFGIQPVSQACVEYINETGFTSTEFTQRILSGYVQGDVVELPAGTLSIVAGAEHRKFDFTFDPGALFGPIAGFNTATPAGGGNEFMDFFGEALIPIVKDQEWARNLELSLGIRHSTAKFTDRFSNPDTPLIEDVFTSDSQSDLAYKAELSWEPIQELRVRASYQRAVRAPNFGELFSGGGSFPSIFDPCSATTNFRQSTDAQGAAFCVANGIPATAVDSFAQSPGGQAPLGFAGNTELEPEKADTWTAGLVFQKWGFTGSLDYYNIKISDPIFGPDPNLFIAACFNYQGNFNEALDETIAYCDSIVRSGGNISFLAATPELGGDENSNFILVNQGKIKTSGIDFQLGYTLPTDAVTPGSKVNFNLLVNYLIDFKVEELPGVTLDYAGTVSYFGQGLGTSFPEWKGTMNVAWQMNPITLSSRIRYIDGMKNRASVQFPGEEFTGTDSVWYFDFAAEANIKNYSLRIGVNNAFDKQPPQYAPNVQSGTDPSMFDVIGRRAYVSARVKF